MRKSILRFGALALMSMMSIGSWAQPFIGVNGCSYEVKGTDRGADGKLFIKAALIKAKPASAGSVEWNDTLSEFSAWKGMYTEEMGVTEAIRFVVTEIGEKAFAGVNAGGVQIPSTVTKFGKEALKGTTVTHVDFRNVTKIDVSAFQSADLSSIVDYDHFTFDKCNPGNSAFMDAKFHSDATITLGSETKAVEGGAFGASSIMSDIKKVVIKDATGLTEIKVGAFKNRTNIHIFGYYNDNDMHYLPASLTTVGNSAFEGCISIETFRFATNDKYGGLPPRITSVGAYAFKDCDWMDNDNFANVCTSFDADFTYAEGSFQGCGFTGELDLSESQVTVSGKITSINPNESYSNKLGVPENAFKNNTGLLTVKLNPACYVIQLGAFEGTSLAIPEVLPETLWAIESGAFNATTGNNVVQENLYLPQNLKFIEGDAFAYRTISNVYAHPHITGDQHKNEIPYLRTQTNLSVTNTYVPASEKFKYNSGTEQSLVYWYNNRGWTTDTYKVKFANETLMSNQLSDDQEYLFNVDDVTYCVSQGFTPDITYGYITANAKEFTGENPIIYGYIGLGDDQYLTDGGSVPAVHQLKECLYQYPIVLKVAGFEMASATYPATNNKKEDVSTIKFLPESFIGNTDHAHAQKIAEDSKAAYTEIPDHMCEDNIALVTTEESDPVTIGSGITDIGISAFAGTTNLTAITLPATLTTVGANAFADTDRTAGLKNITLPKKLQNFDTGAFETISLQTVTVEYAKDTDDDTDQEIPTDLPADAFASDANNLFIASLKITGNDYEKKDYFTTSNWKKFFDYRANVQTANDKTLVPASADQTDLHQIYTVDEDIDNDGYFTKYYVLKDDASLTQVKITATTGYTLDEDDLDEDDEDSPILANVPVKYVRNFNSANKVQCWYVPFDFKYVAGNGYKFYYIYNATQSSEEADAVTRIGLRAVQNDKDADGNDLGYATIKANIPYIIMVSEAGEKVFYGEALTSTEMTDDEAESHKVVVKDVRNTYTFAGVYQRKGGNMINPWYGISDGKFMKFDDSQYGINAFRFYMAAKNQPNPYNLVKFVFDDEEEDATGIKDVNAETIANAPMFDLMGRQIAAPAKGQVYIQNGVKKLAK